MKNLSFILQKKHNGFFGQPNTSCNTTSMSFIWISKDFFIHNQINIFSDIYTSILNLNGAYIVSYTRAVIIKLHTEYVVWP